MSLTISGLRELDAVVTRVSRRLLKRAAEKILKVSIPMNIQSPKEGWDLLLSMVDEKTAGLQKQIREVEIRIECYEATRGVYALYGESHPADCTGQHENDRLSLPYLQKDLARWQRCKLLVEEVATKVIEAPLHGSEWPVKGELVKGGPMTSEAHPMGIGGDVDLTGAGKLPLPVQVVEYPWGVKRPIGQSDSIEQTGDRVGKAMAEQIERQILGTEEPDGFSGSDAPLKQLQSKLGICHSCGKWRPLRVNGKCLQCQV